MSDFSKTILAIVFTAALNSVTTTATLSTEIKALTKAVDNNATKLDKFDDRLRNAEIYQAQFKREYLAAK